MDHLAYQAYPSACHSEADRPSYLEVVDRSSLEVAVHSCHWEGNRVRLVEGRTAFGLEAVVAYVVQMRAVHLVHHQVVDLEEQAQDHLRDPRALEEAFLDLPGEVPRRLEVDHSSESHSSLLL